MSYQLNPHMIMHIFEENDEAIDIICRELHAEAVVSIPLSESYGEIKDHRRFAYRSRARKILRKLVLAATCDKVE